MPGGGAEIFDPEIRKRLCPEKISGRRWLKVMETAHGTGIRTNATMLYGHIESYADRVDHLMKLRKLQDKTRRFFRPVYTPFQYHPKNTRIKAHVYIRNRRPEDHRHKPPCLDNFSHIKAYWIMLGEKLSQLGLKFGADDIDGTVIEEKITHSAGGLTGEHLTVEQLTDLIKKAGKTPVERDSFYRRVRHRG